MTNMKLRLAVSTGAATVFFLILILVKPVLDITESGSLMLIVGLFLGLVHNVTEKLAVAVIGLSSIGLYFIINLLGMPIFTAEERFSFLEESRIEIPVEALKIEQRFVTKKMAEIKARKVLGEKVDGINISSQYKLGNGSISIVKGSQFWLFPLEYYSVFKWASLDSVPGYIKVSATDPNGLAQLVLSEMVATPSGYFHESLSRSLWVESSFRNVETHFEVDEDGNPFWVSAVLEKKVVYSMTFVAEVIITNAKTGEKVTYSLDKIPAWVDDVVPEDLANEYASWNGHYGLGFLNAFFAGENVEIPSGEGVWNINLNSQSFYMIGMTSPNATDDSLTSIRVINAKTGENAVLSGFNGAMDDSGAISTINGALGADGQKWNAVLAQPKFIDGKMFYTASIVSDRGLFQKSAMVDANDPSRVFFSDSIEGLDSKTSLNETNDEDEMILVSKKTLKKLLDKISEIEELKKELLK